MRNMSRYLLTVAIVLVTVGLLGWHYRDYLLNPWTRDGRVMANIIQVAPRVSGPGSSGSGGAALGRIWAKTQI